MCLRKTGLCCLFEGWVVLGYCCTGDTCEKVWSSVKKTGAGITIREIRGLCGERRVSCLDIMVYQEMSGCGALCSMLGVHVNLQQCGLVWVVKEEYLD